MVEDGSVPPVPAPPEGVPEPRIPAPRPGREAALLVAASCRALSDRETQLADRFVVHLSALGTTLAAARAADLLHAVLTGATSTGDPVEVETRLQELGAAAYRGGHN